MTIQQMNEDWTDADELAPGIKHDDNEDQIYVKLKDSGNFETITKAHYLKNRGKYEIPTAKDMKPEHDKAQSATYRHNAERKKAATKALTPEQKKEGLEKKRATLNAKIEQQKQREEEYERSIKNPAPASNESLFQFTVNENKPYVPSKNYNLTYRNGNPVNESLWEQAIEIAKDKFRRDSGHVEKWAIDWYEKNGGKFR